MRKQVKQGKQMEGPGENRGVKARRQDGVEGGEEILGRYRKEPMQRRKQRRRDVEP